MDPSDNNISFFKILVVKLSGGYDTSSCLLGQVLNHHIPPTTAINYDRTDNAHSYLSLHPHHRSRIISQNIGLTKWDTTA
jgi:hypothetical protein